MARYSKDIPLTASWTLCDVRQKQTLIAANWNKFFYSDSRDGSLQLAGTES